MCSENRLRPGEQEAAGAEVRHIRVAGAGGEPGRLGLARFAGVGGFEGLCEPSENAVPEPRFSNAWVALFSHCVCFLIPLFFIMKTFERTESGKIFTRNIHISTTYILQLLALCRICSITSVYLFYQTILYFYADLVQFTHILEVSI